MKRASSLFVACLAVVAGTVGSPAAWATAPTRGPGGSMSLGSFPAGVACAYPVSFTVTGGGEGDSFTFVDGDGNVRQIIVHTRPSTWAFTNTATQESVSLSIPAAIIKIVPFADGSLRIEIDGAAIGFNGPSDSPAGPFSTINIGRLVAVVAPDGTADVSFRGKFTLLCPLLEP